MKNNVLFNPKNCIIEFENIKKPCALLNELFSKTFEVENDVVIVA